jgi:hypothetical protein
MKIMAFGLYPIFMGLATLLIPHTIVGAMFALCIVKIPNHLKNKNIGWVWFYSTLFAFSMSFLMFYNSPGFFRFIRMFSNS